MHMNTSATKLKLGLVAVLASVIALAGWLYPEGHFQLSMENELIRSMKQKLNEYNKQLPEDRVYVTLDKPLYEPGETVWLSAFVRDGQSLKPSTKSDIVYVELINPKGAVEQKINLVARNGVAAGDFAFDAEAAGGLYKIRAYTNWMKNDANYQVFERDIQVQEVVLPNLKMKLDFEKKAFGAGDEVVAKLILNTNENKPLANHAIRFVANLGGNKFLEKTETTDEEGMHYIHFNLPADLATNDGLLNVMIDYNGSTESVSRSIPIVLNKIALDLFPEGGDLVTGLESNVAFRARNEFGKPADIEGVVLTEKGSQVASFTSFHQGMGAFRFNPQPGEKYVVKITKPAGINAAYALPEALPRGYVMNVDNSKKDELSVTVNSTEMGELSLIAQVRGKICYTTFINANKGVNRITVPTASFPAGVAQLTLFDPKGIARCERMTFVNKDKQLNITVETDKEKYQPREKVKMTLTVKDESGMPMPASLSLAVVNDQLLSFADDKSGNLLSQLLLQQDITGKVEEPAFYFDPKEEKAGRALDFLLMTAGWRRFTWEQVMAGTPQVSYQGERAIVSGTVLDAYTGKPVANAKLKINGGVEYQADANGTFTFNNLDLSKPTALTISALSYNQQQLQLTSYAQNQVYYIYPVNYYPQQTWSRTSKSGGMKRMDAPMPASVPARDVEVMGAVAEEENMVVDFLNEVAMPGEAQVADKPVMRAKDEKKKEDLDDKTAVKVIDAREGFFGMGDSVSGERMLGPQNQRAGGTVYYRAREFAAPVYSKQETVETRTDFRSTIYWNPAVEVDRTGKKVVEFYASDDITSFRTTVEGIGKDGTAGRAEKNFFTQLPFAMTTKIPVEVATEDRVSIPLTLKNNTDKPLGGALTIIAPDGLKSLAEVPSVQTIMPGVAKTIYLDYEVLDKIGYGEFTIAFKACGLGDAFTQKIRIAPKGFPVAASFSAQEKEKEFSFEPKNLVKGSLQIKFTAFPNVVSDLMAGVAGILQEPYGCFEQTSCTAYPNAMVLDYLNATESKDDKTISRATGLLDRGYKRLTTFEASEKGYEWFGANPAHEGLTAYGLMEFTDMKKAGQDVDQGMIDRTAAWIMSRKDGKGGFRREQHAYHDFGRISDDILNAYIVFALAESGYTDIRKEYETSYKKAAETQDPYMLAMMTNASYSLNETKKGNDMMDMLAKKQAENGSWTGTTHSITYSQGQSLTIETTSLGILALLKSPDMNASALSSAVQFLVGSRSGSGVFSSTQGTILALKALTEYAKFSKKTNESGTIEVYVDGKKAAVKSYQAGERGAIVIDSLEKFVSGNGRHNVKVKYVGVKNPLPYSVAVNWNTSLPESDEECAVGLVTKLASRTAKVGETVRLTSTITNRKNENIPSTMAIIGIPAGFTVQPWQLKELQEKKVFDYYEIKGNNIAIYYRGMKAGDVKEINLDLKAEMPGEYDAPASSAYLYYTNEFKCWTSMDKVTIRKN